MVSTLVELYNKKAIFSRGRTEEKGVDGKGRNGVCPTCSCILDSKRQQTNGGIDGKGCSSHLLWFRSAGHHALHCPCPWHSSPKQLSLQPTTKGQKQERSNRSPRNNPPQNDNQSMHLIKLPLFLFQCADLRSLFLQIKLYIIHLLERKTKQNKNRSYVLALRTQYEVAGHISSCSRSQATTIPTSCVNENFTDPSLRQLGSLSLGLLDCP